MGRRQIVVEKDSFMYKWFAWSLNVVESWNTDADHPNSRYLNGTNLCHMMRVLLFLAPLGIMVELGIVAFAVYSLIVCPIQLVGTNSWLIGMSWRAALFLVLYLWIYIASRSKDVPSTTSTTIKRETLGSLVMSSLRAAHEKTCPLVQFSSRSKS